MPRGRCRRRRLLGLEHETEHERGGKMHPSQGAIHQEKPMAMDDVMDDVRKTARDAKHMAAQKRSDMQDDLLTYTREQPLTALLVTFVIGVAIGKIIL